MIKQPYNPKTDTKHYPYDVEIRKTQVDIMIKVLASPRPYFVGVKAERLETKTKSLTEQGLKYEILD